MEQVQQWMKQIKFFSSDWNNISKEIDLVKTLEFIDNAIKLEREFLDSECLDGYMKDFLEDMNIQVVVFDDKYHVSLDPKSGEGHDFSFNISKETGLLDKGSFSVGEVEEEEDW